MLLFNYHLYNTCLSLLMVRGTTLAHKGLVPSRKFLSCDRNRCLMLSIHTSYSLVAKSNRHHTLNVMCIHTI
nr:hypothetical protein [uncultured bacterium]